MLVCGTCAWLGLTTIVINKARQECGGISFRKRRFSLPLQTNIPEWVLLVISKALTNCGRTSLFRIAVASEHLAEQWGC